MSRYGDRSLLHRRTPALIIGNQPRYGLWVKRLDVLRTFWERHRLYRHVLMTNDRLYQGTLQAYCVLQFTPAVEDFVVYSDGVTCTKLCSG